MGERSGRFRLLILLGSVAMIGAGFLPWWRAGGESVAGVTVPAASGIGLEGPGVVIYGAALAYRAWELWSVNYLPVPDRSPGLALAAVGVALVLYGAGTGFGEPRRS